jgi:hypothetical protein
MGGGMSEKRHGGPRPRTGPKIPAAVMLERIRVLRAAYERSRDEWTKEERAMVEDAIRTALAALGPQEDNQT